MVDRKRKRSGKHSKAKGAAFEREVCRKLSLWVSGGKSKALFWRSSQSGGRATTLRKKGEDLSIQAGDIAAIDPAGKPFTDVFFVECKWHKTLRFDQLVYPIRGVLGPMWKKCREQADRYDKEPLMLVKEDGKPELALLPLYLPNLFIETSVSEDARALFPHSGFSMILLADLLKDSAAEFIGFWSTRGD